MRGCAVSNVGKDRAVAPMHPCTHALRCEGNHGPDANSGAPRLNQGRVRACAIPGTASTRNRDRYFSAGTGGRWRGTMLRKSPRL